MTEEPEEPQEYPANYNIIAPPEVLEGHYADFAQIWHNKETFILDFAAMVAPPQLTTDEEGNPKADLNCRVVTRVRIPAEQVWELTKALTQQLGAWEAENPHRTPPQPEI